MIFDGVFYPDLTNESVLPIINLKVINFQVKRRKRCS